MRKTPRRRSNVRKTSISVVTPRILVCDWLEYRFGPMQVFLTGATGYIGSAVLDAMIKGGHRVTALARDPEKAERLTALGATPVIGEIGTCLLYTSDAADERSSV